MDFSFQSLSGHWKAAGFAHHHARMDDTKEQRMVFGHVLPSVFPVLLHRRREKCRDFLRGQWLNMV